MNIYDFLKRDHEKVKKLLKQILLLKSDEARKKQFLFNLMKAELIFHSKAEERVFYKPLRQRDETKALISHAKKEHQEIEVLLEALTKSTLKGKRWENKLKKFKSSLEHHIKEEEGKIFRKAKKIFSTIEAKHIGKMMREQKLLEQRTRRIRTRKLIINE